METTFNIIAGVASILGLAISVLGLVITVRVWFQVKDLKDRFTRQGLLPEYRNKLAGWIRNIKQHQNKKDGQRIRELLIPCRITLCDMAEQLDADRTARVTEVIVVIDDFLKGSDDLWEHAGVIIARLQALQETVDNLMKTMQWRGTDGI